MFVQVGHDVYERASVPQPDASGPERPRGRRGQRDPAAVLVMRLVIETVERTGMRKDGKGYTQTKIRHYWCECDVCNEGTYVNGSDLTATWKCSSCHRSSQRKGDSDKVPVCKGRTVGGQKFPHEPVEMTSDDPVPGRACRMTPRCGGRHRKPQTRES